MIQPTNASPSLSRTIALATEMASKHRASMSLARHELPGSWQAGEYRSFFLSGLHQELTGSDRVSSEEELTDPVLTADAVQWLGINCLNPYWLWAVIGAAAEQAQALPLTVSDMHKGTQAVFVQLSQALGKSSSITGWPSGYSGKYTPWHVRDLFVRGHLWNSVEDQERGLEHGLILVQRSKPASFNFLFGSFIKLPLYSTQLIFNPLFNQLASLPPEMA
jgi:hypothetical protein